MKKLISVVLSVVMVFSLASFGFAADGMSETLKFDDDGNFKILVLSDIQTGYPVPDDMVTFINEALDFTQPDIVVLNGDNVNNPDIRTYDDILEPIVSRGIPFTGVLGNHDRENSGGMSRDELIAKYNEYDGCLWYDAEPSLHGAGTHNLPILSSDGSKTAFNLWMFDCGDYVYNSHGKRLGYDWVRDDQIEWYKNTRDTMTAANGGQVVPSLAFQHIIPQEPTQKVFVKSDINMGDLTINFQDGTSCTFIPDITQLNSGLLFEKSCPSYGNDGQWAAMVEGGDVLGVVVGHDHINNFIVDVDGVDLIMTPGCTYSSYHNDLIQGARVIEISEDNPWEYSSYCLTTAALAQGSNSQLGDSADKNQTQYNIFYYLEKIVSGLVDLIRELLTPGV